MMTAGVFDLMALKQDWPHVQVKYRGEAQAFRSSARSRSVQVLVLFRGIVQWPLQSHMEVVIRWLRAMRAE